MSFDLATAQRLLDEAIGPIDEGDPKGRKRLRIIRTAAELFAKQGYRKTNVDEVAEHAGVAKGTVYLYFKTKAQILWAVVALEKKEHLRRFAPVFDVSASPGRRLRRFIVSSLTMALDMPVLSRLIADGRELAALYEDLPPGLLEENAQLRGRFEEFIAELVVATSTRPIEPEAVRERVRVLVGVPQFASKLLDPNVVGELSPQRFAEVLAEMLIGGLVPSEQEKNDD